MNYEQANMNESNEMEKQPTWEELAESSSNFISAKNYEKGKKVSFLIKTFDKMNLSEKYGTWQAVYVVIKDGEEKRYGMPGKIAKTLKDQYGVKEYKDVIGKTLTLLVVKATSGGNTFEVVDLK